MTSSSATPLARTRVGAGGVRGGDGQTSAGRSRRSTSTSSTSSLSSPTLIPAASDHPRGAPSMVTRSIISSCAWRVTRRTSPSPGRGRQVIVAHPDDVFARAAHRPKVELEVLPANLGEPRRSRRRGRDGGRIDASTSASGWGSGRRRRRLRGRVRAEASRLPGAQFQTAGRICDLDTPTASGPGSGQPARIGMDACCCRPRDCHSRGGRGTMALSIRRSLGEGGTWRSSLVFIVSCAVCFVPGVQGLRARRRARGAGDPQAPGGMLRPAIVRPGASAPPPRPSASPISRSVHRASRWSAGRVPRVIVPGARDRGADRAEQDAGANTSVVVVPTPSDADVDVDDKIVFMKDESETRERKSEKTTTESVRVDDVAGAVGGDECPVRGVSRDMARRAPTPPTRDASPGDGDGDSGDGRVPAPRRVSWRVPLRDRRVPNTSRANEPSNSETTRRGDRVRSSRARGRTSRSARARVA